MNRRTFINRSGAVMLMSYCLPQLAYSKLLIDQPDPREFIRQLVIENDRIVKKQLGQQVDNPGSRDHGAIPNAYQIASAMGAAMFLQRAASSYIAESSAYYLDRELRQAMEKAVEYLRRVQHSDGTIDLPTTNFHSTPDTGFVVEPLCLVYTLFSRQESRELGKILSGLKSFLGSAGKALSIGGIHTPNHRWVVCMALARIHWLFPDSNYMERIEQWLAEHIDIDPDGQYTEKSSLIYSPLVNRCLITIARLLNRPDLWQAVQRNLDMTLYYIHPNGEVVSEASGRQDQYRVGSMQEYYYPYRFMALKNQNGQYAGAVNLISNQAGPASLSRWLAHFQEDVYFQKSLPEALGLPVNYVKSFPHSNLVRVRRENYDATILAGNGIFMTFSHLNAVLQGIRLHAAFFGSKGQFRPEELEMDDNTMVLRQVVEGPYYQPYPSHEIPEDGNWDKMPRSNRPQSEVQELSYELRISEVDGGFLLDFQLEGTDHVPVAIELGFRKGGNLSGIRTVNGIEDAYLLEEQHGMYQYGKDQISFGPGKMEHSWTQLRGAEAKMDAMSVYITGYTPFKYQMHLSAL